MVKQEVIGTFKRNKLKLEGKKATNPNGEERLAITSIFWRDIYHEGKIVATVTMR
jgi:hypothetical protein